MTKTLKWEESEPGVWFAERKLETPGKGNAFFLQLWVIEIGSKNWEWSVAIVFDGFEGGGPGSPDQIGLAHDTNVKTKRGAQGASRRAAKKIFARLFAFVDKLDSGQHGVVRRR